MGTVTLERNEARYVFDSNTNPGVTWSTRVGAPVEGGGTAAVEGGLMTMAAIRYMADGPLEFSNGDAVEDPSAFLDISAYDTGLTGVGGVTGIASIIDGVFRLDPSLASGEDDCHALVMHADPVDSDDAIGMPFYEDGARFVFGIGAVNLDAPTAGDGVTTWMGYILLDASNNGWQFEAQAYNASVDTMTCRYAVYPVTAGALDYNNPLFESDELDGNKIAGIYWFDHYSDGRWELWYNGTSKASGTGLFDQQLTQSMALRPGQRDLVADTPEAGFWVPLTGYAVTQVGVPLYTFGPKPLIGGGTLEPRIIEDTDTATTADDGRIIVAAGAGDFNIPLPETFTDGGSLWYWGAAADACQILAPSGINILGLDGDPIGYNPQLPAGARLKFVFIQNSFGDAAWQMVEDSTATGSGTGDVTGPASSTDGAPAGFDGTDGKTLKVLATNTADGLLKLDGDGLVPENRIPASIARDDELEDLSGVTDAATARTNLGLGTASTADTGAFDAAGAASGAVSSHVGDADPHSQYVLKSAHAMPMFGSGADGDIVFSTDTTITSGIVAGIKHYRNVTIDPGVVLTCLGGIIYVSGTLTIGSGGRLSANGGNASVSTAGAASGGFGGINASASLSNVGATGSTSSGAGQPTSNPSSGTIVALGGAGGAGGAAGSAGGPAGLAATMSSPITEATQRANPQGLLSGIVFSSRGVQNLVCGAGRGGGGGNGNGAAAGGGGGGGGGALIVVARHLAGTGTISADGGTGGTPTGAGNRGGGGGGGGGFIGLFTGDATNPLTLTVAGGSGGSGVGTGSTGSDGSSGYTFVSLGVV